MAISMTVHPTDQMSAALPTPVWWMTSGAIQCGVPLMLCFTPLSARTRELPQLKTDSLTTQLLLKSSKVALFAFAAQRILQSAVKRNAKQPGLMKLETLFWGLQAAIDPGTAVDACCIKGAWLPQH